MLDKEKVFVMFLSFKMLLVEGLLSKYGTTGDGKVGKPGRYASDNMIPRLTSFSEKSATHRIKKTRPQRCVMCTKHGKRKEIVYCCRECDVGRRPRHYMGCRAKE
jgi:hypothetical protein